MVGHPVIFLDRDGTINVDHGYVDEAKNWEWIEGVFAGLKCLEQAGYKLAIVTNQSGIAHGLYSEQDLFALHTMMNQELKKRGIKLSAIAFCPHLRDNHECNCRKPRPGMAKKVEAEIGAINYGQSWMIGDREKDVLFGHNIGTKTALIKSRYWQESSLNVTPDLIVDSLDSFAQKITGA